MNLFSRRSRDLVAATTALEPVTTYAEREARTVVRFEVDADSGVLYGTPSLDDAIFQRRPISRAEALRVPAVKRARDLICGGIGQFPIKVLDQAGREGVLFSPNLFMQPELGIASTITWTRVVEDLLLFGVAWLRPTALGWHGRPITVWRLDADTVTIQPEYLHFPEGSVKVWPDVAGMIRIDSPNGGLLECSPAIRACIALERAALKASQGLPPMDFFTPSDDADPFEDDDDAEVFLGKWLEERAARRTAYVPKALKYNEAGWDPEKLQLAEARTFAITEVARLTGIDAEELSVSTTSRTYANMQDRRRHRIEDVYGPYMTAIESRMGMDDVTPRGYTATFDTAGYLRLDDLGAAQADSILIAAQVLTRDEARIKRGLEPLGEAAAPAATPDPAAIAAAHALVGAIKETAR